MPAGTKTRYKHLLNDFLRKSQSTLPSSASATTLKVGLTQVPVTSLQAKRSKSGGNGPGLRPDQDLRDRPGASDASREPQRSVDNEPGSSTSGGSFVSQKRKRSVGTDEDSTPSPEKKPKLKLIVGPEKKLKLRLIVGAKSELRRLELETIPAAPTTATIQHLIPLPQAAQDTTPQNNALPGTVAAPGAPGSDASESASSEDSHQNQSPRSADSPNPNNERVLTDAIPLALLDREQQAVQQRLDVRKAEIEATGEDPVPGPMRKKLLKVQKEFDEQQKKDLGPVSFLDLAASELKGKYPNFATPLAEFEKVPDGPSAAPEAGKEPLEWSRTDRELRNNLRSLFPPEKQQPGFLSRAKAAVKAGHIVSTKVPKLRYRKKSTREHDLNWEDEGLDNQLILAALAYIVNLQETIGQLVRRHEAELAAATNEQVTRLQNLPVCEASKVNHEAFLKALETKNAEIARLNKKLSLCVLAARAEREELEGMRDEVDEDRLHLGEERQDFGDEKAAIEEEKRKLKENKGWSKKK